MSTDISLIMLFTQGPIYDNVPVEPAVEGLPTPPPPPVLTEEEEASLAASAPAATRPLRDRATLRAPDRLQAATSPPVSTSWFYLRGLRSLTYYCASG